MSISGGDHEHLESETSPPAILSGRVRVPGVREAVSEALHGTDEGLDGTAAAAIPELYCAGLTDPRHGRLQ